MDEPVTPSSPTFGLRPPALDRRRFLWRIARGAAAAAGVHVVGRVGARAEGKGAAAAGAKQAARTALVYGDIYKKHLTGKWHPERPARCDAIMAAVSKADFADRLHRLGPRDAGEKDLLACHTAKYLARIRADITAGRDTLSTGDTAVCAASWKAALQAAGGVCRAVDEVVAGRFANAFCVVRPPGHHATPARGMGFCMLNNVAIAARYAQRRHRIGKVLIVDWDVHHGNGTQEIFYDDPSVFYFSTHQWPWYPGTGRAEETGAGKAKGTTLNCPLPAGSGAKQVVGAFRNKLLPAANRFRPALVLISAGFDSRKGDPLGRFLLGDKDFAELTRILLAIAAEHGKGRVVSVLEGGYDLVGLASAAAAHCRALALAAGPTQANRKQAEIHGMQGRRVLF